MKSNGICSLVRLKAQVPRLLPSEMRWLKQLEGEYAKLRLIWAQMRMATARGFMQHREKED